MAFGVCGNACGSLHIDAEEGRQVEEGEGQEQEGKRERQTRGGAATLTPQQVPKVTHLMTWLVCAHPLTQALTQGVVKVSQITANHGRV